MLLLFVAHASFVLRGGCATVSSPTFQERGRYPALLDVSAHTLLAQYTDAGMTVANTRQWSMHDLDNFSSKLHDIATQLNDFSTKFAILEKRTNHLALLAIISSISSVFNFLADLLYGSKK